MRRDEAIKLDTVYPDGFYCNKEEEDSYGIIGEVSGFCYGLSLGKKSALDLAAKLNKISLDNT